MTLKLNITLIKIDHFEIKHYFKKDNVDILDITLK